MSYDNTNRLAQVALPGGAKFRCRYDTFGRRVAIDSFSGEAPTGATLFFYDGQQIILEISDTTTYTYIYGISIDEPLLRKQGETLLYYHTNSLGSVVALTDSSGDIVESYEYDVYGAVTVHNAQGEEIPQTAVGNRYTFTGREMDWETGLMHYRARAYNPRIGRFLQRDPMEEDINLYAYVENMPTVLVDPLGLWKIIVNLPKNRVYAGDLVLYDDNDYPIMYAVVRGQGTAGGWWKINGDTPTGTWEGKIVAPGQEESFGPHKRILMEAKSGHALEAVNKYGRVGIMIHGGRPEKVERRKGKVIWAWYIWEKPDGHGKYESIAVWKDTEISVPHKTHGCLRLLDDDQKKLIDNIECLIKKGENEKGRIVVGGQQDEAPKPPKKKGGK